jgi:hypothetical protein
VAKISFRGLVKENCVAGLNQILRMNFPTNTTKPNLLSVFFSIFIKYT